MNGIYIVSYHAKDILITRSFQLFLVLAPVVRSCTSNIKTPITGRVGPDVKIKNTQKCLLNRPQLWSWTNVSINFFFYWLDFIIRFLRCPTLISSLHLQLRSIYIFSSRADDNTAAAKSVRMFAIKRSSRSGMIRFCLQWTGRHMRSQSEPYWQHCRLLIRNWLPTREPLFWANWSWRTTHNKSFID